MNPSPRRAWLVTNHAPAQIVTGYASIPSPDLIIAVDGGLDRCREHGIVPDILMGDLDSCDPRGIAELPVSTEIFRYPADKDDTDTQLALNYCRAQGIREILICNDLAGRIDHVLGVLQNLLRAQREGMEVQILTESQIVFILAPETSLPYPVGTTVSLVPLGDYGVFAGSEGLKWGLQGLSLSPDAAEGISNVISSSPARITLTSGRVVAIITPLTA